MGTSAAVVIDAWVKSEREALMANGANVPGLESIAPNRALKGDPRPRSIGATDPFAGAPGRRAAVPGVLG
jgi:hypothetical protein